ncbi:MAG: hypothetical protein Q8O03_08235 [Nanoarchaeota archaeon]|nr:hypothetical protein [Nanoarchaeota archaeon]
MKQKIINKLKRGRIVSKKDYSSPLSIIIIGEYHYKKDVHLDIFSILKELKKTTDFRLLLLENYKKGCMEWDNFLYKEKELKNLKNFYGDLNTDLRPEEKYKGAAEIFGYLNKKGIQTFGVETERHYNRDELIKNDKRCEELSLKEYYQGAQSLTKEEKEDLKLLKEYIEYVIVKKASMSFVDSSLEIMEKLNKDLAVFVVGDAHKESITKRLDDLAVSYKWIHPKSFDNYIIPVKFYLIEKKKNK